MSNPKKSYISPIWRYAVGHPEYFYVQIISAFSLFPKAMGKIHMGQRQKSPRNGCLTGRREGAGAIPVPSQHFPSFLPAGSPCARFLRTRQRFKPDRSSSPLMLVNITARADVIDPDLAGFIFNPIDDSPPAYLISEVSRLPFQAPNVGTLLGAGFQPVQTSIHALPEF